MTRERAPWNLALVYLVIAVHLGIAGTVGWLEAVYWARDTVVGRYAFAIGGSVFSLAALSVLLAAVYFVLARGFGGWEGTLRASRNQWLKLLAVAGLFLVVGLGLSFSGTNRLKSALSGLFVGWFGVDVFVCWMAVNFGEDRADATEAKKEKQGMEGVNS